MECLFILDSAGGVLIEKPYFQKVPREELEPVRAALRLSPPPPVIASFQRIFLIHEVNGVFLVATCQSEEMMMHVATLVTQITQLLKTTLREVNSQTVNAHYHDVYRLLDMAVLLGFPFLDEANVNNASAQPRDQLGPVRYPWRVQRETKGPGEVYVVVEEKLHGRVNGSGKSDLIFVTGSVTMDVHLPGSPTLTMSVLSRNKLQDCSFHRCVDPSDHLARTWSFVPPEGEFVFMTYTTKPVLANLPVYVTPKFSWSHVGVVFEIVVQLDDACGGKFSGVVLTFKLPNGVAAPSLATPCGSVMYDAHAKCVRWELAETQHDLMVLNGSASVAPGFLPKACDVAVWVDFQVGCAASGVKIDLKVDKSPKIAAIKYVTKAGQYVFSSSK